MICDMKFSIIIPVLNDNLSLSHLLPVIHPLVNSSVEVIVVDGGSGPELSIDTEQWPGIVVTHSAPGRAIQMNQGARIAKGDMLWFLHADTSFAMPCYQYLEAIKGSKSDWGRFNIRLSGKALIFRLISFCINCRSRLTGVSSGDQGIFIDKDLFDSINGFANIPLMEDIELCKRLKRLSKPVALKQTLITSSRRWEKNGVIKTILLMWKIRLLYFFGTDPDKLHQLYYK